MSPSRAHGYGKYAYPASYSYYPTRQGYAVKKKNYYPIILLVLGLAVAVYGLLSMPKIDPELSKQIAIDPRQEVAALVFCNPCTAIDGETVGTGKKMVVDEASIVKAMASLPGVKQIKLLGPV